MSNTARPKESITAPSKFDGAEDFKRKNFKGKHKRPGGHSGKGHMKKHRRSKRR
jgi:hypothetical protein